jgi:hypothetical protein
LGRHGGCGCVPDDNANGADAGAVYVFARSDGSWTLQSKIIAPDGQPNQWFGSSVALFADTLLVGAPLDDNANGQNAGAAYLFTRSGQTWTHQAKLMPAGGEELARAGEDVALLRDTALVASPRSDSYRGKVHVFTANGGTWSERQTLRASDGLVNDYFGRGLAVDGDTALIAASSATSAGQPRAGAVYAFERTDSVWVQRQRLAAPDAGLSHYFGTAISLSGDMAVIGVQFRRTENGTGAAYLFSRVGSTWIRTGEFDPSDRDEGDYFGTAVALSGGTALIGESIELDPPAAMYTPWSAVRFYSLHPRLSGGAVRVAGADRYQTAVAASRAGFFFGAPAVVIATGENWPDALGGSSLAGVARGPLLLSRRSGLPAEVRAEIQRLGAVRAYVLGGTGALAPAVENELVDMLGRANVVRLAGVDRYETAYKVAVESMRLAGPHRFVRALVATGSDFPDAVSASPLAARHGWPVLLAGPRRVPGAGTDPVLLPVGVDAVIVLGQTGAVPQDTEDFLVSRLGDENVARIGGIDRYETARLIAMTGLFSGMRMNGVGIATGENFPDALAGGPMLASFNSVMLLTRSAALSQSARTMLETHAGSIDTLQILGGTGAVSPAVEAAARTATGL